MSQRRVSPLNLPLRLRRKVLNRYLFEGMAKRLYDEGRLVNNHDLTCPRRRVFLAAVAIVKGEASFLAEWIEFHRMMGVGHFIIYDNGLEPETEQVLAPYVGAGLVTRIPWPDISGLRRHFSDVDHLRLQELAYGNCVRRYAERMDWLLQIDIDEFIYPVSEHANSVADVLSELQPQRWLGLRVPLLQFGSSGHVARPAGLVLENYTRCEETISRGSKSIGNARMIARDLWVDPHQFRYPFWKTLGGRILGAPQIMNRRRAGKILRVNHYRLKSREDYQVKADINAGGWQTGKKTMAQFEAIDATHNCAENRDVLRFLDLLKQRLATRPGQAGNGAPEIAGLTSRSAEVAGSLRPHSEPLRDRR